MKTEQKCLKVITQIKNRNKCNITNGTVPIWPFLSAVEVRR